MSEELGRYDLKDIIITEYEAYLNGYSTEEITASVLSRIERSIELQAWSNGIANIQEAVEMLV